MRRNSTTRALDARPLIGGQRAAGTSPVTVTEGEREVVTQRPEDTTVDEEPPWAVRQLKSEIPSVTTCRLASDSQLEDEDPTQTLQSVEKGPPVVAGHRLERKLGSDGATGLWVCERVLADGQGRRGFAKFLSIENEKYLLARSRLLSEAQVVSGFSHPSLLALEFADEDELGTLLVYDHLRGTNLGRVNAQLWARGEALPLEVAVWIICETLRGLHYMHTHRDRGGRPLNLVTAQFAPGQVLLTEGGHVRLATFALQPQAQETSFMGPQGPDKASVYIAPECLLGSPRTASADLYAVGAMLFELITGRPLLPDCMAHEIHARAIEGDLGLQALDDAEIPEDLANIVRQAMACKAEDRFLDAASMAAALAGWMESSAQHAMPSTIGRFLVHELLLDPEQDAYGPLPQPPTLVNDHDSTRPTELVRGAVADMFTASFGKRPQVSEADFMIGPGTMSALVIAEAADPLAPRSPWSVAEEPPGAATDPASATRPMAPVAPPVPAVSRPRVRRSQKPRFDTLHRRELEAEPLLAGQQPLMQVAPSPWSLISSVTPGDGPTQQLASLPMAGPTTLPQPRPHSFGSLSAIYVLDAHRQRRLTAFLCAGTGLILAVLLLMLLSR